MSERVRSLRYLTKHYLEKLLKHGQKIDKDGLFLMEQLLKERSVIVIYVVFLIKAKVKKYLIL